MIQRIQTVYLLLTTFIAILFLSGDIISFSNGDAVTLLGNKDQSGASHVEHTWLFTGLLLVIPVLSFLILLLYKNRKLQIRLTTLLIFLVTVTIVITGYYVITGNSETEPVFSYKLVLPLLMLIFSILALAGIRKDENIVRSYDRLR